MRLSLLLAGCIFVACVPKRDLPPDQIQGLTTLAEVMHVQATIADPQFKKIGQTSYADQDWAAFADVGNRLQVTSKKIPQFSKGPEFDKLANQLGARAQDLAKAAEARDVNKASEALGLIKATCKECHSSFK